jgi:hypothetical protein
MNTVKERREKDHAAGEASRKWLEETTKGGPKGNNGSPKPGSPPPTELEVKVRGFLSSQNRHERRSWLRKQSIEAGKIRRWVITRTKDAE